MVDGKLIANPTYEESKTAKINIVVAGTEGGIVMVESGSQQATRGGGTGRDRVRPRLLQEDRGGHQEADGQGRQDQSTSSITPADQHRSCTTRSPRAVRDGTCRTR